MANIYATVDDVALVWDGVIKPADQDRVQQLLDFAHALLRARSATLDSQFDAGTVDPLLLQMTLVNAVIRVLNNPKGVQGAGVGETNFYYAQTGADKFGTLYIDEDDLSLLGLGGKNSFRAASFRQDSPFAVIRDDVTWRW